MHPGGSRRSPAERALEDIKRIERLGAAHPLVIDFYRVPGMPANRIHAAVYSLGAPIRLSERVPVLENLGFAAIDERSYHIRPRFADGARDVTLHDMVLETSDGAFMIHFFRFVAFNVKVPPANVERDARCVRFGP